MNSASRRIPDALRHARFGVNLMFFTNGALFANLLPRWPMVKDQLGVDAATFGLLVACFPLGAIFAGPLAGSIIRHFTSARTAMAGTFVVALALLGAAFSTEHSIALTGLALFVGGSADAIVDVGQNAHGLRVQRGYGRSIINSFHAAWSAGAVTGGVMGSAAVALDLPLVVHLAMSGALFSAAAVYAFRLALPGADSADADDDHHSATARDTRSSMAFTVTALAVIALAGTFVEDAGSTWSAIFMRDVAGATGGTIGLAYVAMVGAQFAGRLTGDGAVDRHGRRHVARVGAVLISVGMGLMLAWPSEFTTVGAFALAGYGCATLVPAAFDAADRIPGLKEGSGLTLIGWLMRLAFLAGPPIVGAITDWAGLRVGLIIVPLGAVALIFAARVLPGRD